MMMPANYSAVAENEVIYGGGVLEFIGDRTPDVWTSKNVKKFTTNLVTILSNTFTSRLVGATMGTMFGGNWGGDDGLTLFGSDGTLTNLLKYQYGSNNEVEMNGLNKFMNGIGLLASIYTLGTTNVKNFVGEAKGIEIDGYNKW